MEKTVWLSFDLGARGDYESLYAWLDNHGALECGSGVAFLKCEIAQNSAEEMLEELTNDLKSSVEFRKSDRVYVIYRGDDAMLKGRFIVGKRKAAPWQGYGYALMEEDV